MTWDAPSLVACLCLVFHEQGTGFTPAIRPTEDPPRALVEAVGHTTTLYKQSVASGRTKVNRVPPVKFQSRQGPGFAGEVLQGFLPSLASFSLAASILESVLFTFYEYLIDRVT
jgi:hypothetical protein